MFPERGVRVLRSKLQGFPGLVVQPVEKDFSPSLLLEVKSAGKPRHDTPVFSLCRGGRLDLGGHIKNWRRTVDIFCEMNDTEKMCKCCI